jgi:hypothetical protein
VYILQVIGYIGYRQPLLDAKRLSENNLMAQFCNIFLVRHYLQVVVAFNILTLFLYLPLTAENIDSEVPVIIDSIEIVNENVFNTNDHRYDNFLFRLANNFHFVTKPLVIRRELLLAEGDAFDTSLVNESERNLRSLPYLYKTDIYIRQGENRENILVVNTSDKWSTIVGASFHRSGRRDDYQFGFEENNLLGYGIQMTHDFYILEDDRNYYQGEIIDRRFMGQRLYMDFFYSDNPRAGITTLIFGRPFYQLSQKYSFQIDLSRVSERTDYYLSEFLVARDKLQKNIIDASTQYRIGPDNVKYYFMLFYRFLEVDWQGRIIEKGYEYPAGSDQSVLPELGMDSTHHYMQLGFRWQQINFAKYTRLNRFDKPEDINRGIDFGFTIGQTFHSKNTKHFIASLQPQYTIGLKNFVAITGFLKKWWFNEQDTFRQYINLYFKGYWQYDRNHTLVINTYYLYDKLSDNALRFYLDEDNGLRGYPVYYRSGEKEMIINIENRVFSNVEILSIGLGGAIFADIGNIWDRDTKFSTRNVATAFGIGLRFGITRSTQAEIIRLDAAYAPKLRGWQISFGTGQFF